MKKVILFLLIIISFSNSYSQNSKRDSDYAKRAIHYAKSAVREFNLDLNQYKELLKARRSYVNSFMSISDDFKNNKISEEQKTTRHKNLSGNFNKLFSSITGKNRAELKLFKAKMRKELKKI